MRYREEDSTFRGRITKVNLLNQRLCGLVYIDTVHRVITKKTSDSSLGKSRTRGATNGPL